MSGKHPSWPLGQLVRLRTSNGNIRLCQFRPGSRTFKTTGTGRPRLGGVSNGFSANGARKRAGERYASSETAGDARSVLTRTKNLILGTVLGAMCTAGYFYATDTRAGMHRWLVVPLLRFAYPDGEEAHQVGNASLRALHDFGIHIRERVDPDAAGDLETTVFGYTLVNPIGFSAGIDKHCEIPDPLFALGPSVIEIGGATPYPQDGNPKPRVFRVPSHNGLINRYGLNSEGADFIANRLRKRVREFAYSRGLGMDEAAERAVLDGAADVPPGSLIPGKLLAVQIAKNSFTPVDDIEAVTRDYVYCVERLAKYADLITLNISSPNTERLRDLQRVGPLTQILSSVVAAVKNVDRKEPPKVLVKVSPDEDSDADVIGCCEAVLRAGADGIIVGNTTTKRPESAVGRSELSSKERTVLAERGGYSGPQLFERTVSLVQKYRYYLTQGTKSGEEPKVLFATGGITNGKQALEVLQAGASVAMVYTAMVYGGAGTASRIKQEMREEMKSQLEQPSSS